MTIDLIELLKCLMTLFAAIWFIGFAAYAIGYGYTLGKHKGEEHQ